MKRYKFYVNGWCDEDAYICNAFTLSEAIFLFEHFMCYEQKEYNKFTVEIS